MRLADAKVSRTAPCKIAAHDHHALEVKCASSDATNFLQQCATQRQDQGARRAPPCLPCRHPRSPSRLPEARGAIKLLFQRLQVSGCHMQRHAYRQAGLRGVSTSINALAPKHAKDL
eukprot:3207690-Pleurochrysis_carterae.AAC.1